MMRRQDILCGQVSMTLFSVESGTQLSYFGEIPSFKGECNIFPETCKYLTEKKSMSGFPMATWNQFYDIYRPQHSCGKVMFYRRP